MRVLLTGIAGKNGRLVSSALRAQGHEVVGIDKRAWPDAPAGIVVHRADIRKRAAEEVFRASNPDAVIHMATVTHLGRASQDRYRINLQGTQAVFDYSHRYDIKKVLFVGRHTFYGASDTSPLYHTEDAPPQSENSFPELSDLVAADLYAGSALWRYPEIDTAILRICYTLGPAVHGTLASFLRGRRVPTCLGFDPLFQYMHDADVAEAIAVALKSPLRGVFNVAGPMPVPLSTLIQATGRRNIRVPEPIFRLALGRLGLPHLPKGAIAHLKFPVTMNTDAFRKATGFKHKHGHEAIVRQFRAACPLSG